MDLQQCRGRNGLNVPHPRLYHRIPDHLRHPSWHGRPHWPTYSRRLLPYPGRSAVGSTSSLSCHGRVSKGHRTSLTSRRRQAVQDAPWLLGLGTCTRYHTWNATLWLRRLSVQHAGFVHALANRVHHRQRDDTEFARRQDMIPFPQLNFGRIHTCMVAVLQCIIYSFSRCRRLVRSNRFIWPLYVLTLICISFVRLASCHRVYAIGRHQRHCMNFPPDPLSEKDNSMRDDWPATVVGRQLARWPKLLALAH